MKITGTMSQVRGLAVRHHLAAQWELIHKSVVVNIQYSIEGEDIVVAADEVRDYDTSREEVVVCTR